MFGDDSAEYLIEYAIDNTSLPVLLYDNPQIHKNESLPIPIIKKYSDNSSIIGIKDSSGDWDYFKELLEIQNPNFSVLQGKESYILKSLLSGADGIVAGAANVNPEPFRDILYSLEEDIMQEIMELKGELEKLDAKSIPAIKQKLVQMSIIRSAELFR